MTILKEMWKEIVERADKDPYASFEIFEQLFENQKKEFENILDKEIENEKDAIKRKAHRNWTIVQELEFIKRKLKEK